MNFKRCCFIPFSLTLSLLTTLTLSLSHTHTLGISLHPLYVAHALSFSFFDFCLPIVCSQMLTLLPLSLSLSLSLSHTHSLSHSLEKPYLPCLSHTHTPSHSFTDLSLSKIHISSLLLSLSHNGEFSLSHALSYTLTHTLSLSRVTTGYRVLKKDNSGHPRATHCVAVKLAASDDNDNDDDDDGNYDRK